MATTTPESNRIILKRQEDWEKWYWQLQTDVNSEIWPYIDPDQPDLDLQVRPAPPAINQFNGGAQNYADLTAAQQKSYDNARRHYEADMKLYSQQQAQLTAARTLIRSTVTTANQSYLNPQQPVRQWIRKLKNGFKPEDGFMKSLTRKKYREVMNEKNTRLAQWLDQWEDAMVEGIRYNIPEIQEGIWLSDLADRIQPYSEYQAGTIRAEARDEDKKDAERFGEKARTLRQDLS